MALRINRRGFFRTRMGQKERVKSTSFLAKDRGTTFKRRRLSQIFRTVEKSDTQRSREQKIAIALSKGRKEGLNIAKRKG